MHIFVEGSSMIKERSGIGQFAKRLVEAYSQKYPGDKVTIFGFKFFTQGRLDQPIGRSGALNYRIIRWFPGRIYNQLYKMGLAPPVDLFFRGKPGDFFIFPNFVRFPLLYNRRSLLMIHDLSFIHFSQYTHPKNLPYMLKYVPQSIKRANRIITISKSSKRQIVEHYGVPAEKIFIVTPAVDAAFFRRRPKLEVDKVRARYKLPRRYILFTGTIEPRKNILGLLKAYENLPTKTRAEYPLVLAGGKGWQDEKITEYISGLAAQKIKVVQTGYVEDADLPAVYSGASVFVWPSHYEGFGIPLLEAMACGVPVITANNSSLPEVAGEAAILLNSTEIPSITLAMQNVLNNEALKKKLIAKGYEQIKKFTWDKSADQLKKALESF